MDIEHNHVGQLLDWVSEHWPIMLFAIGTGVGSAWYSLHRVFATKKSHILLKNEFDTALTNHEKRELAAHEIRHRTDEKAHEQIHNDIKEMRQDVRELVKKLIH